MWSTKVRKKRTSIWMKLVTITQTKQTQKTLVKWIRWDSWSLCVNKIVKRVMIRWSRESAGAERSGVKGVKWWQMKCTGGQINKRMTTHPRMWAHKSTQTSQGWNDHKSRRHETVRVYTYGEKAIRWSSTGDRHNCAAVFAAGWSVESVVLVERPFFPTHK